ncbi:MAG: TonB-dependent receptor [candidate division KSB1 bacterium]|nr:TonB-dependent receptor [candidate division KSB1 bacterium]
MPDTKGKYPTGIFLLMLLAILGMPLQGIPQNGHVDQRVSGVITGRVYDAETMEPLGFTDVFLDSVLIGAAIRSDGTFIIRYVKPGTYRLIVRRIGYQQHQEIIHLQPGKLLSRTIALKPTVVRAEEVTVTAARREQTAQMAPASVMIINSRDLRERSIVTFDQALELVSGLDLYRASGISVQSLSIRGSSDVAGGGVGNRVLLLIDGRPALTSDSGGALWSLIPTSFIEQVEVVKGAFSSLYGSTAMGGVINVITRRPTYKSLTTVDLSYGFYEQPHPELRFTNEPLKQSQIEISHSGVKGRMSYLLNFSRKQSDGYTENTAYKFYNVFGKLLYDFRENRNLEISLNWSTSDNDYPHTWMSNLQPYRVLPKYRDDRQQKNVYSADVLYWAVPSTRAKYSSRFYFYRTASRSFFNENDPNYTIPGNQPFGLRTLVDADKFGNITQFDYYLNDRHYLIVGLDTQIDRVQSDPDTIMYGDRQVNNVALYLQDEWEVTPELTTTLGLRYDWNHLVNGITQGQLSPKIALVYHPRSNLAFRLLLGQAFRAPSIAERFFQKELSGGTLFKPNPKLKAEKMDFSMETGVRWHFGEWIDLDLAYFRYHYRDMIYWVEISAEEGVLYTLFQVRNLNKAFMQGLEVAAK